MVLYLSLSLGDTSRGQGTSKVMLKEILVGGRSTLTGSQSVMDKHGWEKVVMTMLAYVDAPS